MTLTIKSHQHRMRRGGGLPCIMHWSLLNPSVPGRARNVLLKCNTRRNRCHIAVASIVYQNLNAGQTYYLTSPVNVLNVHTKRVCKTRSDKYHHVILLCLIMLGIRANNLLHSATSDRTMNCIFQHKSYRSAHLFTICVTCWFIYK